MIEVTEVVQSITVDETNYTIDIQVGGTQGPSGDHLLLQNIGTNTHAQIDTDLARLANTSGTNTGDQDLSGKENVGVAAGLVSAHEANLDPHPQYLTSTEGNTAYEPKNSNIQSHISSTSNPHSVTKSQVGLSNVDNTSDADKPISTATQNAFNNIVSPNDLTITKTGEFIYDYAFQLTVPNKVSYKGTVYSYSGKWIESFNYLETLSSSTRKLTSLSFDDLEGIVGLINFNQITGATSIAFPELKIVGGSVSFSTMSALTSLSFAKLIGCIGTFSITTANALTSLSFPELLFSGNISLSTMSVCTTISMPKLENSGSISVSSMGALTALSFPLLKYVNGSITPSGSNAITTYNFPEAVNVTGTIGASGVTALTTMNFPKLLKCAGGINTLSTNNLSTLNFPLMTECGTIGLTFINALNGLSLPSLQILNGTLTLNTGTIFATLSLPSVVNYAGTGTTISVTSLAALTTVTMGTIGTLKNISGNVTFSGCALNQASVNGILALIASLDGSNGTTLYGSGKTVTLSGGTNAAPSYTGGTPPTRAGSSFVGVGTTCTVSWTGHGYTTGDYLTISGITTLTNANGTFQITVVNANTFTYTITSQTATGAGTATVKKAGSVTDGFYYQQVSMARGVTVSTN